MIYFPLKCDFLKIWYFKLLQSVISVNVMLQTSSFQEVLKIMLFRSCINVFKFSCRIPEFWAKTSLIFWAFWARLENSLLHKEHLCYKNQIYTEHFHYNPEHFWKISSSLKLSFQGYRPQKICPFFGPEPQSFGPIFFFKKKKKITFSYNWLQELQ